MKCKKAKWLSEEALDIAQERRETKGKGEKERIPIWMENSKEEKREVRKPSSVNMQRNRGKEYNGRVESSSRKLKIPREYFMQRWAQ